MGTRGLFGFKKDGKMMLEYNHFDSYPTGIGYDVIKFLQMTEKRKLNSIVKNVKFIEPTNANYRGNMVDVIESGIETLINDNSFANDSLFCEWAYIINMDDDTLDIYKGFVKENDIHKGDFKNELNADGYNSISLIHSIKRKNILKKSMVQVDRFLEKLDKLDHTPK